MTERRIAVPTLKITSSTRPTPERVTEWWNAVRLLLPVAHRAKSLAMAACFALRKVPQGTILQSIFAPNTPSHRKLSEYDCISATFPSVYRTATVNWICVYAVRALFMPEYILEWTRSLQINEKFSQPFRRRSNSGGVARSVIRTVAVRRATHSTRLELASCHSLPSRLRPSTAMAGSSACRASVLPRFWRS